jgi:hypothetical protein
MKTPQRKASALQSTAVAVVLSTSSSVFYFFSLSGGVGAESPSQRALTAGESELVTEFLDALVEISGVDERHHSFYTLSPEQRTELKAALEAAVRAGATRPDLLAALFDHHAVETHRRQKVDEAEPSTSSASASTRPENLRLRVEEDIQKKAQNVCRKIFSQYSCFIKTATFCTF